MRYRTITLHDVLAHPRMSLNPRDYLTMQDDACTAPLIGLATCGHRRAVHHFFENDGSGYCDDCWKDPAREPWAYHVFTMNGGD